MNRDNQNSLNKLGEIFDKTKVEERQELANLFGELAYDEIHKLADKNGWKDGDTEKDALHALVGGIMSELTGNGFLAGASASAVNEMVQKKLSEQFEGEPDKHQWASAIIGGIVLFIFYYIDCSFFAFFSHHPFYRSFTKNSFVKSIILVYTIARILGEYSKC